MVCTPSLYPPPPPPAPCPPMHVSATVGCENRTASVSWSPSPGALAYTATLEHTDGQTTCCSTAGTGCHVARLPCGHMFVLLVTAEGRTCNSSQSPGVIIRTGEELQPHPHWSLVTTVSLVTITGHYHCSLSLVTITGHYNCSLLYHWSLSLVTITGHYCITVHYHWSLSLVTITVHYHCSLL